jgi:hypothetical protein
MACPPSEAGTQGRQGLAQRKGSHRHQMISATNDMNSTGSETGEDADQQGTAPKKIILQDRSSSTVDQVGQGGLHILLTHQRFANQHGIGTSGFDPVQIRTVKEA